MKNTKSRRRVIFEPKMRLNKTETRNKVGYRLYACTSAIKLYPRCMALYPGHFFTINARHLDCLARFAGCHVFTLALHIVTPVKYRLYLTYSFLLVQQVFNILYM